MAPVWAYLPPWTLQELLEANSLQAGQSDDVVTQMFSLYGGKARQVLTAHSTQLPGGISGSLGPIDLDGPAIVGLYRSCDETRV